MLFLAACPYDDDSRLTAHGLKDGKDEAVAQAVAAMARCLPDGCILIPAPGRLGYAKQALLLAEAIGRRCGAEVADVLKGACRRSNYEAKKEGQTLTASDFGFYLAGTLPEGKVPVFIDNVVDAGATALAASSLLGGSCIVLSYSMTDKLL